MVALSQSLAAVALFLTRAEGARSLQSSGAPTRSIAGVPVLYYERAFPGAPLSGDDSGLKISTVTGMDTSGMEVDWLVCVKPGTSDDLLQKMCEINSNGCIFVGHPIGGAPIIEMLGTETDLEAVLIESAGAADFVEPNGRVDVVPIIEDDEDVPVQAEPWGLNRIGAYSRGRTGAGVTIYIQDTGVRYSHTEFGGRASPSLDISRGVVAECNEDVFCALDRQGHGTHCAGTAAGATYGVAPSASVRSVKTLNDDGGGELSWQIAGIDWVSTQGARPAVLSMSLGARGQDEAFRVAIDAAVNVGLVVVVAAGNSNNDACNYSPAFVESAITVGSTTKRDKRSGFSNYGPCTNIWAPGSGVVSAGISNDTSTSKFSGTSMACPHVSGAAALVLEASPSMEPAGVLEQLTRDALKGVLAGLRDGDVNVLLYVAEGGAPPTDLPPPVCPWYCQVCALPGCKKKCWVCQ